MQQHDVQTIDEYIARFPPNVQEQLATIRATIREVAPEAEERISYQMPTFALRGNLVHFAAWKNHIGFYPAPSGIIQFADELAKYVQAKGSIHFPMNEPLPLDLIRNIVEYRVNENRAKAAAKQRRRKTNDT